MRRFLTTLMILLIVIVAGLSALVLLLNPNDFRDGMIKQVLARSGYQLKLDGPLRWHVWPQLSILSERMTLTEPGARVPLVRADNMRLDVLLLPLFSHKLQVNQIILKGAVIELPLQTEAMKGSNFLRMNIGSSSAWPFDISRLKVTDSVLVFQHPNDEPVVTIRDIRLQMEQNTQHQATVEFSGRINRDQRDWTLSCIAQVNSSRYLNNLSATFNKMNWTLQGAELPAHGISGQASFQTVWKKAKKTLSFSQIALTSNNSVLRGEGYVMLGNTQPHWTLNLQVDGLNLDNLLGQESFTTQTAIRQQRQTQPPRQQYPVIADNDTRPSYSNLRGFSADLLLKADQLVWRGMNFSNVSAQVSNQFGLLMINQLQGEIDGGQISLPGTVDVRSAEPVSSFQPKLENVNIATMLKAFNYPVNLTGKLSFSGTFSGEKINTDNFRHNWQGQAKIELREFLAEGFNFQKLVQQAVKYSTNVTFKENFDSATRLDVFASSMSLNDGVLNFSDVMGESSILALNGGTGSVDLINETGDMCFNVRILDGLEGDSNLVAVLKKTALPLRIYGPWESLSYSLQVDRPLCKQLQHQMKHRFNQLAERNNNEQNRQNLKELLNKFRQR